MPHTNVEVDIVVRGLGLAEEVIWYVEAIDIQPVLEATKGTKNDKYLLMTFPSRHFVRVKKVFPNGVEVMNPEVGFELWTWETIAKRQCWLGVFLSEQDAIRMGRKQPLIQKAP